MVSVVPEGFTTDLDVCLRAQLLFCSLAVEVARTSVVRLEVCISRMAAFG
jgi:hypothetical protein